jgi:inosose dehydratase
MHFAYSTINWDTTPDLQTVFAEIRAVGWRAVELFDISLDWLGTPDRMRGLLDGLVVATGFGVIELSASQRHLTIHKRRIEYLAQLGATAYGLVGAGRPRAHPPSADDIKSLARGCDDLAIFAHDLGVKVAYHPHTRCTIENEREIDALMHETTVLTLCLDVSHIALVGEDPVSHLRKYRERLGYVHLKDWGRGEFCEIGCGTLGIDFAACFRELEAQQFLGWCVVEHSVSAVSTLHSLHMNAATLKGLGYGL